MARVILQAGHHPNAGGAPGEAGWAYKLCGLIAERLRARGVVVPIVGDFFGKPPPPALRLRADLFFAVHYDAAIYGGLIGTAGYDPGKNTGGFADRAAGDPMAAKSDRAIREWEAVYPRATGIPLANHRRNARTWAYYAFNATTDDTPGIIVEHGCGAPVGTGGFPPGNDAAFLHNQIDRVADADAIAILAAIGVQPQPTPPEVDVRLLEDWQVKGWVLADLYQQAGVPFNPEAATVNAWVSELRAGRWRGRPRGPEHQIENGVWQEFEHGSVVWVTSGLISWEG